MLETELKAMLTKAQYDTLKSIFQWTSVKEQTNSYYIAPENILKKHGITFRVRTIDDVHTVQIKKHQPKQSALQIAEETEFAIDKVPETFNEDETERYTGIRTVASFIGELTTKRRSCFYSDGVEICLDRSTYLGITDYEIETEYTNDIPKELLDILAQNGVLFDTPTPGKFSRFINRLKNTYLQQ